MEKDRLDAFLAARVSANDEAKKAISMWWKQEQ